ncbi:phosphoglycerate mutase [Thermobispora bispora]|uniref:Phosphoglycerate mutase n=1 Tax=Thermobispora bispora (strain ATCC 19993 / DSM 43833 / CBS 139.67 / JCM 10125 / KCTC 9307 / NBRC 14880 / R51) TaxID=469371 RepID=D6Y4H8_THEBD|nr:histidine phosphatase family protein [Thermobispora bispora]MBO2474294.1 histidine phosphatase family protein [Actinomycetales bacterium]MDI9581767.1 histidine phosphatase family protein [Thermobispora sp.]ADG89154.1 Phosphoglycerate mutase [Thermobispora bispora DSM 43833]MBX6168233.1 histidine phosphatase family protein [Thermobispora bispora]QSI48865.1 histidine phosphatase family protein [Thermobispora bispora]
MSRRVVCLRHGQTVWNVEHRFQGHSDIALNEVGVAQAERAASLLAALRPTMIVSSDLRRAYDTAVPLARLTNLEIFVDKDLRERGGGAWEGLTREEIKAGWPVEYEKWEAPGGEDPADVAERVAGAILRWRAKLDDGGLLVVVSHGAAIRLGIARLLGLPQELWSVLGGLGNCSWSVLEEDAKGWRLLEHNAGTLPEPVSSDDTPNG